LVSEDESYYATGELLSDCSNSTYSARSTRAASPPSIWSAQASVPMRPERPRSLSTEEGRLTLLATATAAVPDMRPISVRATTEHGSSLNRIGELPDAGEVALLDHQQ